MTAAHKSAMSYKPMQYREISRYGSADVIERIDETRWIIEKFLTLLQSATPEPDRFVSHLYQARREYRRTCETAGKSGKQIEQCVISSFRVAENMGFTGDFRQWENACQDREESSQLRRLSP